MGTLDATWSDLRAKLRKFIGTRVSDPHDADDLTQDVLLKLHARPGDVDGDDTLRKWAFAVARNAIIDHYRARAARAGADGGAVESIPAEAPRERDAALGELSSCLAGMVRYLPEPYRTAMTLADLQGLSHAALAQRTDVSLTAAKSRVRRARRQAREMLLDCCDVEHDVRGGIAAYQRTNRAPRYCGVDRGSPTDGCAGREFSAPFSAPARLQGGGRRPSPARGLNQLRR